MTNTARNKSCQTKCEKKKHIGQNQQEMKVMKPSKAVTVSATVLVFHLYI